MLIGITKVRALMLEVNVSSMCQSNLKGKNNWAWNNMARDSLLSNNKLKYKFRLYRFQAIQEL